MTVPDQAAAREPADRCAPTPPKHPQLHIETNELGQPVRVFVGALNVTHLVARVQTNTTMHGTHVEVVLEAHWPPARSKVGTPAS